MKEATLRAVRKLQETTKKPVISIKATPAKHLGVTVSKFGGTPFLPKGGALPLDEDGLPLKLLAQINCTELPENNIYPKEGLLQFWIQCNDMMGLAHEIEEQNQCIGHRIIYYKNLEKPMKEVDVQALYNTYDFDDIQYSPIDGEYSLSFTLNEESISSSCYSFDTKLASLYNVEHPNTPIETLYDIEDVESTEVAEEIYDLFSSGGHKIGGYPEFTQTDIREEDFKEYEVLLLQIDSDWSEEHEIMWGDAGVGNFFITQKQLDELDFSKVLYNWDCS